MRRAITGISPEFHRSFTGVCPLTVGTVKTICARSGAFKDNPRLRELFSLPAIQSSTSTALAVPSLPYQEAVTGDKEIDAVLWLREVIKTGQADLIGKAMEAAKRIKTPLRDLEKRYLTHLTARDPGNWTLAFKTIGFADLMGLAQDSTKELTHKNKALARFGSIEALFADTPAEKFATDALAGLKPHANFGELDEGLVDKRFQAYPDLMPNTLSDCLYELAYWHDLYTLRHVHDGGDQGRYAYARECFAFRCLARICPKSNAEAIAVFRYLANKDCMDWDEADGILLNLMTRA
jgi:hypothetical protein